jgi:hypothetical protein
MITTDYDGHSPPLQQMPPEMMWADPNGTKISRRDLAGAPLLRFDRRLEEWRYALIDSEEPAARLPYLALTRDNSGRCEAAR